MSILVVMIPSDLDGLKDGIFLEEYWVVQVYFGKVALLCTYVTCYTSKFIHLEYICVYTRTYVVLAFYEMCTL